MATDFGGIAIRFGWGGHDDADQVFSLSLSLSLSIGSAALAAALALSAGSAAAEVTVQLAVPGDPANQPLKTVEITGSQIDGITGGSFSPIAAQVFNGLTVFRAEFAAEVKAQFEANPEIKQIYSATPEKSALIARLRQAGDGTIPVTVTGMDVVVTGKADVDGFKSLFCPSVDFGVRLRFSAAGAFRASDLTLTGLAVNSPSVDVLFADCNGIIGPLVDLFAEIFGPGVADAFQNTFESEFRLNASGSTVPTMFALSEVAAKVDQALPSGPIKDKVMATVDRFLYLASQPASLQLEVKLHPDLFGPGNHLIALTASSIAPQAVVTVDYPLVDWFGGTPPYDVYLSYLGTTWKVATTNGTSWFGSTNVHTGTRVLVVSTNPVVPGLKSFPAEGKISFVPGGPDCPTCSLR